MEDNQNYNERNVNTRDEYRPLCANHPFMRALLSGLLTFLGAFCAFYVVSDWHFKRAMRAPFMNPPGVDRMMRRDIKAMDKVLRDTSEFSRKSAHVIHLEQDKNFYKVFIDLRAFDNNENNVQVSTNGNILTINGKSIKKSKNNEQISEFQQHYMFGNNVKLSDLTKETNGKYYVITIPIGGQNSDNEDED
ncbi:MAG: Hsp20/alpha crystallin family protein [Muribaculaceae bacterium]|nr:Hsp20/alpha crystallin family protein [Muribaculaceae bacterium]